MKMHKITPAAQRAAMTVYRFYVGTDKLMGRYMPSRGMSTNHHRRMTLVEMRLFAASRDGWVWIF